MMGWLRRLLGVAHNPYAREHDPAIAKTVELLHKLDASQRPLRDKLDTGFFLGDAYLIRRREDTGHVGHQSDQH